MLLTALACQSNENDLQSLLRGRFLRNGTTTAEDGRPISVAARELGQLRQGHPVSGLRYSLTEA